MPDVPLRCWTFQWLGLRFNPLAGRGRLYKHPVNILGWAHWRWFTWHALWNNSGRLCFQAGSQQWFREDGWVASVEEILGIRTFTLTRGAEVAVKCTYGTFGTALMRRIDVTWDDVDESNSDFFSWAVELWSDRRKHDKLFQGPWSGKPWSWENLT
jgi:hypothetical protein